MRERRMPLQNGGCGLFELCLDHMLVLGNLYTGEVFAKRVQRFLLVN
jgi:hypothetical protein